MTELKEHDAVSITNPTATDFAWRYNGEAYTVKAGETTAYSKYVTFHLAHHLATEMVIQEVLKDAKKKDLENPKSPIHTKVSQVVLHDSHERRIALYKILGDELIVQQVIMAYPFKGFIGEMDLYKKFVEKEKAKKEAASVS